MELEALVAKLLARVSELEARLKQNSRNSSKPPSSDGPGAQPRRQSPSGKKRGGQEGHEFRGRELLEPDEIVTVSPSECPDCHHHLPQSRKRHSVRQVLELPELRPHVTQYHLFDEWCPECRRWVSASMPGDVAMGEHGPRLSAAVSLLTGKYKLPKRAVTEIMGDFFGTPMATGTVCKIEQAVSEALSEPVADAHSYVKRQPSVHIDETSWRENKNKAWLWLAATNSVAVFHVSQHRSKAVAKHMLGDDYEGIVHSDRYSAYNWLEIRQRQACWSHLKRDFEGMAERGHSSKTAGVALYGYTKELFDLWYRVRDGTLTRKRFRKEAQRIRKSVRQALEFALTGDDKKSRGMAAEILSIEPALWTFVRVEGIEPTNNHAERCIRPAVLWRKGSFGTDSAKGSRFMERILTTVTTLRLQGRNLLAYVTEACEAHLRSQPAPTLLPTAA